MLALLFLVVTVLTVPYIYCIIRFTLVSDWAPLLAVVGTWAWVWFLLHVFSIPGV